MMKNLLFLGLTLGQIAIIPMDTNCKELSSGTVYYCDNVNDLFQVDKLEGITDQVIIGKAYPVTFSGALQEQLPEGSVLVTKHTREDKEHVIERDLCEIIDRRFGMKCPIEPHAFTKTLNITLPTNIKPGSYSLDMVAWTPDERRIFGIKYSGHMSFE